MIKLLLTPSSAQDLPIRRGRRLENKLITLFIALALLLSACGDGQILTEATPTPYATPVKATFTVQRGDITVESKLNGRVTPLALHTVYFQIDGEVREVFVNINDVVKEGQLLGELAEAQGLKAKANETQRTIRRAQIDLEIAKLTLEQYKAQNRPTYEIQIQELNIELAQMNFDEALEKLGIDANDLVTDELNAQIAQARAFAPADGTIIATVNIGRKVAPTTAAFVLGDPKKLEVTIDLAINDNEQVREMFEGMPVTVTFDAKADVKITGTIRQLPSPYGTGPSDENLIHVSLDKPPTASTYQVGDKATVIAQLANKQDVLWLPPEAIRSISGRTFVIINSENGPTRVDIEIGLKNREMVEIVSGLTEGQVVVGP